MPKILADQHADASETRIKRADGIAPCEKASFIEKPIRWQINFMVNMHRLATRKVSRSDKEAMTGVLIHKTNDEIEIARGFEQMLEDWVIFCRLVCGGRDQILQNISS